MEVLALDFLTVDQASDGTKHVLTMTDEFTKFTVPVATPDLTAAAVVKSLNKHLFL